MNTKQCKKCKSTIFEEDLICPDCNTTQHSGNNSNNMRSLNNFKNRPEPKKESDSSGCLGSLFAVIGMIGLIYFFLIFDTSVPVPTSTIMGETYGGGRVNNLGLMSDRQNGMIFSGIFLIVGVVFYALGKKK